MLDVKYTTRVVWWVRRFCLRQIGKCEDARGRDYAIQMHRSDTRQTAGFRVVSSEEQVADFADDLAQWNGKPIRRYHLPERLASSNDRETAIGCLSCGLLP